MAPSQSLGERHVVVAIDREEEEGEKTNPDMLMRKKKV